MKLALRIERALSLYRSRGLAARVLCEGPFAGEATYARRGRSARVSEATLARAVSLYVFAYGSLLFRPGFRYVDAPRVATVYGWARRFAQGSPDHRGTPERPGRVVTLVRDDEGHCEGAVFHVHGRDRDEVLAYLDHRERGGYERTTVRVHTREGNDELDAVTWVAPPENPHWLGGSDDPTAVARHALACEGPSGRNEDYVRALDDALRIFDIDDAHVRSVAAAIASLRARSG